MRKITKIDKKLNVRTKKSQHEWTMELTSRTPSCISQMKQRLRKMILKNRGKFKRKSNLFRRSVISSKRLQQRFNFVMDSNADVMKKIFQKVSKTNWNFRKEQHLHNGRKVCIHHKRKPSSVIVIEKTKHQQKCYNRKQRLPTHRHTQDMLRRNKIESSYFNHMTFGAKKFFWFTCKPTHSTNTRWKGKIFLFLHNLSRGEKISPPKDIRLEAKWSFIAFYGVRMRKERTSYHHGKETV